MKWNVKGDKIFAPYKKSQLNKYKKLGFGTVMSNVLVNRKADFDTVQKLLKAPSDLINRPIDMAGCQEAGEAIADMIQFKRKIWVFADYDVDGLTSGYIMSMCLTELGADVSVHYPERKDGYGLSLDFVKTLSKNDAVITVDNGITANEAVNYCNKNNIAVVITDHHEPGRTLPQCPICDPHLDRNGYGHHLCGAAVAWKICQYVCNILGKGGIATKYMAYAAIGTIADVMPMTPENQAIVIIGLKMINDGFFGSNIKKFAKALKIDEISTEDIAWKIAPELNACSRLGNANLAAEFLFYDGDKKELQKLMLQIDSMNESRKSLTAEAVASAKDKDFSNDLICMFDATDYPVGIAGVIANKIMDTFGKPAIVYTRNKGAVWPASSRSPGINLLPLYEKEKRAGNIKDYGGHAAACGLSLLSDVDTFKNSMNVQLKELLKDYKPDEPVLDVDAVINFSDFNKKNLKDLSVIPTDRNVFPAPKLMIEHLKVSSTRRSGNNPENICFTFVDDNGETKDIWAWGKGSEYESLGCPKYLDVIGNLKFGFGKESNTVTFGVEEIRCSS